MDESCRDAVKSIFESCSLLSETTGRPFSPDGHLVGSLGEVIAADLLGLTLMSPSNAGYDATDADGRRVEIKTTTAAAVGLSASGTKAERLVVLQLDREGRARVSYDGSAARAWEIAGKPQKNGQRRVSVSKLAALVD